MDNFELDSACKTLAASKTNYSLAKEVILLRQELEDTKKEAFQAGYGARDDGDYPDMTYQENVDHAYSQWSLEAAMRKGIEQSNLNVVSGKW